MNLPSVLVFIALYLFSPASSYDECKEPLIENGYNNVKLTATSRLSGRGPENARIYSTVSWTSGAQDFDQYLQIELPGVKNITEIGTMGRAGLEFVKEYTISFAVNGQDYSVYKENDGSNKVLIEFYFCLATSKAGNVAWQPSALNFTQWLIIDLRKAKRISSIATLGLRDSYVSEYALQSSIDGDNWRVITASGHNELFKGNSDGDTLHKNVFQTPIIAQFIRINPTRWHDRISMRVELYGCDYVSETLYFNGSSLVYRNLTYHPIQSRRDIIKFRFKTAQPDGILIYSKGTQSDFFALQLVDNRLILNINLGSGTMTSISAGSLLDDNLWHDVIIDRYLSEVRFTVDRVEIKEFIKGDFQQLDLNRVFYIGGTPNLDTGLITARNFTGCLENLYLNNTNVIYFLKNPPDTYYYGETPETFHKNHTFFNCPNSTVVPVTFLPSAQGSTSKSFIRLKGYEGIHSLNVTFEFRTYQDYGVILYHKFTSTGYCKLYMEKSKLLLEIQTETTPRLVLDNFATDYFTDGLWHRVVFSITKNSITLSVDEREVKTTRLISIFTGGIYYFGGMGPAQQLQQTGSSVTSDSDAQQAQNTQQSTLVNYVGCLRQLSIDGNFQNPMDWKEEVESQQGQILFDSCQMLDRCNPNPCEHGATCKQNSLEFDCDCEDTGYTGAVCHIPLYPLSCSSYQFNSPRAEVTIDIDGSGPMEPFPVTCQFTHDSASPRGYTVETILHHKNEDTGHVDGCDEPGCFSQEIFYDAPEYRMIEGLLNRSSECKQYLKLECKNARLFNSPALNPDTFSPSTWWVSRTNEKMDYWGGSVPGSRKCECGIIGQCQIPEKWCNCDSGLDTWLSDEGWLTDMEYLPVRRLSIGDTGTVTDEKQAKHTLGPLICKGDALYDNEITFRLPDAALEFPILTELTHSWDIYFEFKTTTRNAVMLHAKGPSDYIKVEIINGNLVTFQVEAGSGPMAVNVPVTGKLNDNQWHSIHIEKNRKQSRIVLDGSQSATVLQPAGQVRTVELTSNLFIGRAVDSRDGYVGCLRALMVNGIHYDLKEAALASTYGVGVGCQGKCESSPCLNNGTCDEGYDRYTCDCRFTSFKGPICADEIGVNLQSNSYVKYDFYGSYKSTIAERLRVGFTTTEPKGFLVGLFSNKTGEYLTLMVSNSGHLRLVFDFGFERQELIFPEQNFATGQYHDVEIRRSESGTKLTITVDNFAPQSFHFDVKASADAQFNNIQHLYIGKNESMREGFIGCVSRVEFDDIFPLKYYFQENRPKNIRSYPETLIEDFCGVEPVTHPPEIEERRPDPDVSEEKLAKLSRNTESAVLGGVLAVLFLIIVLLAIIFGRYWSQHKGAYLTQEDDGAVGVSDPNIAVVQGSTGHHVGKKREWFI